MKLQIMPGKSPSDRLNATAVSRSADGKQPPFFPPARVQPKLTVNAPGDVYEREADAVAERVIAQPAPAAVPAVQARCETCAPEEELQRDAEPEAADDLLLQRSPGSSDGDDGRDTAGAGYAISAGKAPPPVQAACAACGEEEPLQRQAEPAGGSSALPDLQADCEDCRLDPPNQEELDSEADPGEPTVTRKEENTFTHEGSRGRLAPESLARELAHTDSGQPLPGTVRRDMEGHFGADFGGVRVHTDSRAAQMNRSIQAKAFTHGRDLYFNAGRFSPETREGKKLLAHELTHVIQQQGSAPPRLQRAAEAKIGNWAHFEIQSRLRANDKKLITEAPIPGGTRDDTKHNSVGFADLYKAEKQTVGGIMAEEPAASKDLPATGAFYRYKNMARSTDPLSKWGRINSQSAFRYGPRIVNHKRDQWDFTPNFPANFQVGEIKPLFPTEFPQSIAYHGTGFQQTGNYRQGFQQFVERVYRDHPQHQARLPASITGRALNLDASVIPAGINYALFEQQRQRVDRDGIYKRDTGQRIWLYKLRDGVYVYFLLHHPYTSAEFPAQLDRQLQRLDPLLARLRRRRPRMNNQVLTKREDQPQRPPVRPRPPAKGIQAKGEDRGAEARTWEEERQKWVRGTDVAGAQKPRDFLKQQARAVERKGKVDDKLNIKSGDETLRQQIKSAGRLRFWSGFRGRILGALRFRFAGVFDKVEELFERMKEKFRHHHKSSDVLNEKKGIFGGWKKTATRAIIRFSVEIFKEMLVQAFRGFVNCINDIIGVILNRYTSAVDDLKQEVIEEVKPVCCEIMVFKKRLDEEYQAHAKTIATFTDAIQTIKQWTEILDYVETAVRIGVQVVSCGLPPGLGCLWGLVAQVGIEAGLSLLARTDYFENRIAKPAARKLMDAIVGDSLHNFLVELLEKTPLQPFVADAASCRRRVSVVGGDMTIGGGLDKLDPNDPAVAKARAEWEQEYQGQILKDLQAVFEKGKGRKVTKEDLDKLVKLIQESGKTPEEIRRLLESARNPASGKLKLETAAARVESGEAPAEPEPEREIDYEKATKNNAVFQQLLGWDPFKFYKKPGVKADSEEFATAVYDMQKALGGIKADGILGEGTIIRFYEKNGLKQDALYQDAVKMRDKRTGKGEEGRSPEGPAGGEPAPEPKFKTLEGREVIIRDQDLFQHVPRGVGIHLHHPSVETLLADPKSITSIDLDIYVDKVHTFRIHNVAVESVKKRELLAVPENIPMVIIDLFEGIQLTVKDEVMILREQVWRTD